MKIVSVMSDEPGCDLVEIRFDYLEEIDPTIIQTFTKPIIATLRPLDQGGKFSGSEQERLALIKKIARHNPTYFDLEHTVSDDFISEFYEQFPSIMIIRSYHNFDETPENLDQILDSMNHKACHIYKMATYANTSIDTLRMLHFVKKHSKHKNIVAHCMGEVGVPSRILGVIMGNVLHYAGNNAPGSVSLDECLHIYRLKKLNSHTKIYALLGDPVDHSVGHEFHNQNFEKQTTNAVYVKFKVTKQQLPQFFTSIKGLQFTGFSVTMPLKEAVLKYATPEQKDIAAVNTLRVDDEKIMAINTDGPGALDALEKLKKVNHAFVLIIGAGGAAKAIAMEAKKRGASKITIINRTFDKAKKLAEQIDGDAFELSDAKLNPYDFVINTLPPRIDNQNKLMETLALAFTKQTIFMDINYAHPLETLARLAQEKNCRIVDGYDMFENQALLQSEFWR